MKILIKKGTIVNPDKSFVADILIEKGRIVRIDKSIKSNGAKEVDARGKHIFPGFIDMHVHLRTPGQEYKEDLYSGSMAAAKGGVTTVCCMPNTVPPLDNEGVVKWIREESEKIGIVDIYPIGAATVGGEGKVLTEFVTLKKAGAVAISDDGVSIRNTGLMRRALEYAKLADILFIAHCEDEELSSGGAMRESFVSSCYGISAVPGISETIVAFRNIALARYLGAQLHIAHVSSARTVEIIKHEKVKFPLLTCETAPHYFTLTVEDVERSGFSSNFKVNPPLGEVSDRDTVLDALQGGVIDCIATDHAPHSHAEKENPFEEAPSGVIGLETVFSLVYMNLVERGVLTLEEAVTRMSSVPAKILGFSDRGCIQEGMRADIVIADLENTWEVKEETIVSKSKNTPFLGKTLKGVVETTICNGKVVYARL